MSRGRGFPAVSPTARRAVRTLTCTLCPSFSTVSMLFWIDFDGKIWSNQTS